MADTANHRIRRIRPPLPDFSAGAVVLPSGDGRELYAFDAKGRHLETRDARTGVVLLTFGYDPAGRLLTIADRAGLVTAIERDPPTGDPEAIVAPFGQRTALTLNGVGWLETVTDPESGVYTLGYHAGARAPESTRPRDLVRVRRAGTDGLRARTIRPWASRRSTARRRRRGPRS